jgi:hypothetical protein
LKKKIEVGKFWGFEKFIEKKCEKMQILGAKVLENRRFLLILRKNCIF